MRHIPSGAPTSAFDTPSADRDPNMENLNCNASADCLGVESFHELTAIDGSRDPFSIIAFAKFLTVPLTPPMKCKSQGNTNMYEGL